MGWPERIKELEEALAIAQANVANARRDERVNLDAAYAERDHWRQFFDAAIEERDELYRIRDRLKAERDEAIKYRDDEFQLRDALAVENMRLTAELDVLMKMPGMKNLTTAWAECDRLRHDIERHVAIASEHAAECERLRAALPQGTESYHRYMIENSRLRAALERIADLNAAGVMRDIAREALAGGTRE